MPKDSSDALYKALLAGGYAISPGILRQGCVFLAPKRDGTPYTEEELDVIWEDLKKESNEIS